MVSTLYLWLLSPILRKVVVAGQLDHHSNQVGQQAHCAVQVNQWQGHLREYPPPPLEVFRKFIQIWDSDRPFDSQESGIGLWFLAIIKFPHQCIAMFLLQYKTNEILAPKLGFRPNKSLKSCTSPSSGSVRWTIELSLADSSIKSESKVERPEADRCFY